MNRPARPFRRTVLIVVAAHLLILLFLGLPLATCRKPPAVQPVEMIDLGSLRPGPGLPAAPSASPAPPAPVQEVAAEVSSTPQVEPEKIAEPLTPPNTQPTPESKPTPPSPTPTPKPEPKKEPLPKEQPTTPVPPKEKHQVKVSSEKKKSSATATQVKTAPAPAKPAGPTSTQIKDRLSAKISTESAGSGGDGAGIAGRPDGTADDFAWYRALIKQSIQASWKKPPIPAGEKIFTEVEITIAPGGQVTFQKISRPSGDSAMDASVEQAVRSTPLLAKPLPAGLGNPHYTVIIQFKLE